MTLLQEQLSELDFRQQCLVLGYMRNAIELYLIKHQNMPWGGDPFWIDKAREAYTLYRRLGGYESFAQLEVKE
jgi:hypothetical protein